MGKLREVRGNLREVRGTNVLHLTQEDYCPLTSRTTEGSDNFFNFKNFKNFFTCGS